MSAPWFSTWRGEVLDNRDRADSDYVKCDLKMPQTFDLNQAVRAFIGWGGVSIFDGSIDVLTLALDYVFQYQNYAEACGRCAPGRAGGRILFDILDKIARGEGEKEDIARLKAISGVMRSASKCEIGRTTPNAVLHLLEYFPESFDSCISGRQQSRDYAKNRKNRARITAPCIDACPDRVDIPAYVEAIKDRRPIESLRAVRRTMPLAHVCSRVCPHPCEAVCRRKDIDEPLNIMELKRVGADYEFRHRMEFTQPFEKKETAGKRVAVIGAGPAGLTAGYFLSVNGVECDIFESLPVAGGEVMVGVPEYRMPYRQYLADIEFAKSCGAKIHLNSVIDKDKMREIERSYDAILLATGARLSKKIRCENEDEGLNGYWGAIDFLDRVNLWEKFGIGEKVDLSGKTVVCVGGGFTSMDVVRCAIRANAKRAIMLYRRDEQTIVGNTSLEEYKEAVEEGVEFIFHSAISRIEDEEGTIKRLLCSRYELRKEADARAQLFKVEGADFEIECDYLIPAVSQSPDLSYIPEEWEIAMTSWGTIKTDGKTYATTKKGVFSAGDCEYGPMTIVNAVGQARRAASVIARFLRTGEIVRDNDEIMDELLRTFRVYHKGEVEGFLGGIKRLESAKLPVDERRSGNREISRGLMAQEAFDESERCMRCYYIAMVAL
ncbi:MAG: FAD-dependent oxidoreductase [Helicobacteraceae bacterium]|jgi:formate dehydrogenase beta subunit|nr:FAD-dependent oxidoreductase [Helicobacteraceae bacterium]